MSNKNLLVVISGPSGVGKGTIVSELLKRDRGATLSVSCTTREPREGEREGVNYFYITREEFEKRKNAGGFLEYSEHFGNLYGTPRAFVEEKLKGGDVYLEIEVDGALNAKRAYPEALMIMILPPSREELERRLRGRGSESDEAVQKRLARADYELSKKDEYDYRVVNDNLSAAVQEIIKIIESVRG